MKILLLSAYDAASHRVWREGLVRQLNEHDWTVLTLPPRFFAWRSRGNPLSWVFGESDILKKKYDIIVATSMTNLAALKGIASNLAVIPTVVYFHENQFAYPEQHERKEYQNYKFTNIYTALAADRVLFNSRYNMDTFMEGAEGLLSVMPDHVPKGIVKAVQDRSEVLSVPLEEGSFIASPRPPGGPLVVVWNHRWEHDKAPDRFFQALYKLRDENIPFKVNVVGQRFRDCPPEFDKARERLGDNILTWGFVEDKVKFRSLLASSDVVISTALHDFQGLGVLEGVAAGCLPVIPDRLAYPEFFPEVSRYSSFEDDGEREVQELAGRLEELCRDPEKTRKLSVPNLEHLSWENMAPCYREIINSVSRV
ncbi:MAG: DUF3524 domain-containing protein [bacterium]|nr:DUF3524 domain-containing protein [bacterium]MDT8365882.1 DUF3524 domain-containing protein [bacterium]